MSNLKKKMLLQLFAEGGDGGAASAGGAEANGDSVATGVNGTNQPDAEIEVPASIPEKAKEFYRTAIKKHRKQAGQNAHSSPDTETGDAVNQTAEQTPPESAPPARVPFSELIKSAEYKDEFTQYMNAAIKERFKGRNARDAEVNEILSVVASKYGLDPRSQTFLADLKEATKGDDAYFEAYAAEHDMTTKEARRVLSMEQEIAARKRADEEREDAEYIAKLHGKAAETQKRFPYFNLDAEMKNPVFVKHLAAAEGDTTAAFMATHYNDVLTQTMQKATDDAARATVRSIRGGAARPAENGISAPAVPARAEVDYSRMNLKEIRAAAAEMRKKRG